MGSFGGVDGLKDSASYMKRSITSIKDKVSSEEARALAI